MSSSLFSLFLSSSDSMIKKQRLLPFVVVLMEGDDVDDDGEEKWGKGLKIRVEKEA